MPGRIGIIINSRSRRGGTRATIETLMTELDCREHDIFVPSSKEEMQEAARRLVREGYDTVVAVGGDGSINLIINEIAGSGLKLGVIPTGTANDLAAELRLPRDIAAACAVIKRGQTRKVDLININGRHYVTGGGIGAVSDIAVGVNRLKARPGLIRRLARLAGGKIYSLYTLGYLLLSRRLYSPVEVHCDGRPLGQFPMLALFVNNQPTIGRNVTTCPRARSDDGLLEACILKQRQRLQNILTVILMTLRGRHGGRREVEFFRGRHIEVRSSEPKLFIGDGETLAKTRYLSLQVVPQALEVLVA